MKNLLRYLNIATLFIALSAVFAACSDNDENGDGNLGLNIKVFAPTVVVPGTPMTINGSGFGDVTEIIFPGDITVTAPDFEIVTNEMIRVKAPAGLSQEGTISVKNAAGEVAVSRLPLTIGSTSIKGFPEQKDDETFEGNQTFTVYGIDMQFVSGAEFVGEEDEPIYIPASEFLRVAPGRVVIQIPAKVKEGESSVKIFVGSQVYESPVYRFKPASDGGHWEITKRYIWENDGTHGEINWDGAYRFSNTEHMTGEEIFAIPMEDWNIIKNETFYLDAKGSDWVQMRITTGWWSTTWTGEDITTGSDRIVDNGDGTYSIEICFAGDPILDVLDEQHLLFTGGGYTPQGIYVLEKKWVGGEGHFEKQKVTFWKNGEHSTIPAPSWSGEGRFARASNSSGEETWTFTDEEWEILKTQPFRIAIEKNADWVNLRVTTGWWSTNYMGLESLNDLIEQDEDGTYFVEINLANDPALLALVDEQHLLFTGQDYKLLEIYQETEVWVGGGEGGASETVIWENDGTHGEISWDGAYRFCNAEHMTGEEIFAIPMDQWDVIRNGSFWLHAKGSDWVQMRITTGWWSTTWTGDDISTGNERIIDNGDGTYDIEICFKGDPILDVLDEQHLLFTGGGYTPLKLYYK